MVMARLPAVDKKRRGGGTIAAGRADVQSRSAALPDDLDQHPLGAAAVELAVEDLFPTN
jgi:hypothetical protein